jgi:thioredoxin reductase (NADPH)
MMPLESNVLETSSPGTEPRPDLAFPFLSSEMIDRLYPYGTEQMLVNDEPLFSRGQRDVDFFVILNGRVACPISELNPGCDSGRTARVELDPQRSSESRDH